MSRNFLFFSVIVLISNLLVFAGDLQPFSETIHNERHIVAKVIYRPDSKVDKGIAVTVMGNDYTHGAIVIYMAIPLVGDTLDLEKNQFHYYHTTAKWHRGKGQDSRLLVRFGKKFRQSFAMHDAFYKWQRVANTKYELSHHINYTNVRIKYHKMFEQELDKATKIARRLTGNIHNLARSGKTKLTKGEKALVFRMLERTISAFGVVPMAAHKKKSSRVLMPFPFSKKPKKNN